MSKDLSGIPVEEFQRLQRQSDVKKWLASERAGRDLCGSMSWCVYCLRGEEYPCAKAQFREKLDRALDDLVDEIIEKDAARADYVMSEKTENDGGDFCADDSDVLVSESQTDGDKIADDSNGRSAFELNEKDVSSEVPSGYKAVIRYRRSFKSRIIQSERLQDLYTEIKNALLGLGGVKSRIGQNGENFRYGKERIAKLCVSGKTMSLFLALSPSAYEDSRYRFEDVSDKKTHADTPMRVKITGTRTLKQAKLLLQELAAKYELVNVGNLYTDYHCAYRDDDYLIQKKLIRPYTVVVKIKK